ncbi:IS66 family transposase, partial [Thiolapillus sp.]|uniref:IS66 family transposase n=7 Tax=Thiolapillus sp. TaxID=2017437 RepID=UPI003AF4471E
IIRLDDVFKPLINLLREQQLDGDYLQADETRLQVLKETGNKRVFGLVIDFGTSQSPKSTRPLTTHWCPSRPGHQALRNNFASSLLLRTWLPMTGRRVRRPTLFSLWRKARRENSAASRLLGSTSLRFALHGWQRSAQSDKWMWVIRGGPPDRPAVLFEYDPSRSEEVPLRLLDGFKGTLQTDGYAGYNRVCRENGLTRIGCW